MIASRKLISDRCASSFVGNWTSNFRSSLSHHAPPATANSANSASRDSYVQNYLRSLTRPEDFWAEAASKLVWEKKWDRVLDNSSPAFAKWCEFTFRNFFTHRPNFCRDYLLCCWNCWRVCWIKWLFSEDVVYFSSFFLIYSFFRNRFPSNYFFFFRCIVPTTFMYIFSDWFSLILRSVWNTEIFYCFRFNGGKISVCYNAVDRHCDNGHGDQTILFHDSPVTNSKSSYTYKSLLHEVS